MKWFMKVLQLIIRLLTNNSRNLLLSSSSFSSLFLLARRAANLSSKFCFCFLMAESSWCFRSCSSLLCWAKSWSYSSLDNRGRNCFASCARVAILISISLSSALTSYFERKVFQLYELLEQLFRYKIWDQHWIYASIVFQNSWNPKMIRNHNL